MAGDQLISMDPNQLEKRLEKSAKLAAMPNERRQLLRDHLHHHLLYKGKLAKSELDAVMNNPEKFNLSQCQDKSIPAAYALEEKRR